ncbi:Zinc finger homeobox [Brachionus plicatilis]|uniref:Zinc finger homeobox n=1 Tax=Brachionus plicatilis TaxID=10195 RepID=A0A3M7P1P9_BRAPC|nr:Zinc finger homeobox [Brachionus plicatilis]
MNTDNQSYFYQYENVVYNSSYLDYSRQSLTPPQSIGNSSTYSTSPEQSYTSSDTTCYYPSPHTSYSSYYPLYSDYSYSYPVYSYYNNYSEPCNYSQSHYNFNFESTNSNLQYNQTSESVDSNHKNCKSDSRQLIESKILNEELTECMNVNNDKKRRIRTQFTMEQKKYLLTIFRDTIYPSKEQLEMAAHKLAVSMRTVQTWFKNTRSKQKKVVFKYSPF